MNSVLLEHGPIRRQFVYRPGTSDESVMSQLFKGQNFDLMRLARQADITSFLERMRQSGRRPLIVDLGANIGASSVYFALNYPGAQVVAVEPEPDNFKILCQNTADLNVCCLQAAIAAEHGRTRLVDPGGGPWAMRTSADGKGPEIPCITMSQILLDYGKAPCEPFLVKIDIEGAEKDLFRANTKWVSLIPVLVIELHDWMMPREGTALPFLRCISALDRDFTFAGEHVFSIDNQMGHHGAD